MPKSIWTCCYSTFAIFNTQPLWILIQGQEHGQESHCIQPSNLSGALKVPWRMKMLSKEQYNSLDIKKGQYKYDLRVTNSVTFVCKEVRETVMISYPTLALLGFMSFMVQGSSSVDPSGQIMYCVDFRGGIVLPTPSNQSHYT